ncbi:hypothetical protein Cch01nite_25860 [Cellulomonas chitinilytica]|uniref:DUF4439 domain-containing protein n=1 Tax=Cellulomonas chitinilytica TaxID=398759 RepID=A0A919U2V9_9CELL|nr:DUF4439 domain-containing protein [Cellulomonas chitinilytica]GIG21862.1 hypothetical protein Cch01nite_25860 [Cellulomonas chitinilytica]
MNDPRHPRQRPASTRLAASRVIFVVLACAALAGCGVRLETPPPAEPSPDAVEQVRARTVDDALQLEADATALLAAAPPQPVQAVLTDVAAFSTQHAEQLGGEYVSGLPTPTATTTPSAPPAPTVEALLADLAGSWSTAATDADAVADADLARLVASVAVARSELAARLSAATSLPVPQETADDTTPAPAPSPAADGPSAADLDALALVHDQAGFGFEVVAAKLSGDQRSAATASADQHRRAGGDWARAAGSAGTPQDPRRAAYTLPTGMDDPAVAQGTARSLETSVADTYATVVARVPAGKRAPYVDGLRRATVAARAWGATPVAFPGLPERAQPAPAG